MQGNSATTQDWKPIVLSKRPAGNRTAKSEADAANARASGAAVDTVRRRCVPGLFLCFFFFCFGGFLSSNVRQRLFLFFFASCSAN
jgi:hypothetical protein